VGRSSRGWHPRNFSPCGTVLDRDVPLLFSHPERHFTHLAGVTPFIDEGLLIPFHLDGEGVATIWVIAHDESCRFDMEDLRLMTNLGNLAALAYQTVLTLNAKHAEAIRAARACEAWFVLTLISPSPRETTYAQFCNRAQSQS
jgi:GAF domain